MIGALGHVVPGADERLELRERRVHFPRHWCPFRLLPGDLDGQLLQIAEHRHRELEHFDLAPELRLESLERDRVLGVEVREAIDLHRGGGVVERPWRSTGSASYAFLLKPKLWVVPGSCQPG